MTSGDWWRDRVREPQRLAALTRSGLLQTGPEDAFDRLTELAAAVTGAARACITLVDATHYAYKSTVGVAEGAPQTGPIEASFCRYVVGSSKPFVVDDARADPRTFDNPAIAIDGVAAWAGYPIEDAAGWVLGTFCLVATEPYAWTDTDLHVLATLAQLASSELALRRARFAIASARSAADELRFSAETELTSATGRTSGDAVAAILTRSVDLARQVSDALNEDQDPEHGI
jgi:phosphoserine phosphatase RsbU/P